MIKCLKHGGEPFTLAGGSSEMPVCGGEIYVCTHMDSSTRTEQLEEDVVSLYVLYGRLLACPVEKLIHAGVEADCAASGRGEFEVHEDN